MDQYKVENITAFLEDILGIRKINADDDIFMQHRVSGDDFHEMMEKYASKFKVNMNYYRWYFHADEEGNPGLGGYFFKAPYERVKRIPVTPAMLLQFANSGKWSIDYPGHSLPKRRYDLLINKIVLLVFILTIILFGIGKNFRH